MDPVGDMIRNRPQTRGYDFGAEIVPFLKQRAQQGVGRFAERAGEAVNQFVSPLKDKFRITQKFGNVNPALYKGITKGSRHLGLDLGVPMGTQVFAPTSGKVRTGEDRHWGKYAEVVADDGTSYRFSHLSDFADLPDSVRAGELLGLSGSTGNSTGPHIDISTRRNGQYVDPLSIEALRRFLTGGE